jgi:hypothetical protein
MYYYGARGARKDEAEAARLFQAAADRGNRKAKTFVGALQGDAEAQTAVGDMYAHGDVPRTVNDLSWSYRAEAAKWYRKAAEQGYAPAQFKLGRMYSYYGWDGVDQDEVEAARLFKMAADQGYAEAQWYLGYMYRRGRGGLPRDMAEAVKWFTLAASQGCADCQFQLSEMYYEGKEVERNYGLALKWFRAAVNNRSPLALDALKTIWGWAGIVNILVVLFYIFVGRNRPGTPDNASGQFTRRQTAFLLSLSFLCFIVGFYLFSTLSFLYFAFGSLLLAMACRWSCSSAVAAILAFGLAVYCLFGIALFLH